MQHPETEWQRKQREIGEAQQEVRDAQTALAKARQEGSEDWTDAQERARRSQADAVRRRDEAFAAYGDTVREGEKAIANARKRETDAINSLASVTEQAAVRIWKAQQALGESGATLQATPGAAGQVAGIQDTRARGIAGILGTLQQAFVPQAGPQLAPAVAAYTGGWRAGPGGQSIPAQAAGAPQHIYLHVPRGVTVDDLPQALGTPGARAAQVRVIRDVADNRTRSRRP